MDAPSELPPLAGVDAEDDGLNATGAAVGGLGGTPKGTTTGGRASTTTPSALKPRSSTKKGKRVSELQAKFETSFSADVTGVSLADTPTTQRKEVKRESSRRLTQHWETIRWLRENVVTTKEF